MHPTAALISSHRVSILSLRSRRGACNLIEAWVMRLTERPEGRRPSGEVVYFGARRRWPWTESSNGSSSGALDIGSLGVARYCSATRPVADSSSTTTLGRRCRDVGWRSWRYPSIA